MLITHWEHADLVDYFTERNSFFWLGNESQSMFARRTEDGEAQMAVIIIPPKETGPYRMYNVTARPLSWTAEQSDEHLLQVLTKWTAYTMRKKFEGFFIKHLELEPRKAFLTALALSTIVNDDDPEEEHPHTQGVLENTTDDGRTMPNWPPELPRSQREMSWLLSRGTMGGGYCKLSFQGGQLRVELSAAAAEVGGFWEPLVGYVRPKHGGPLSIAVDNIWPGRES